MASLTDDESNNDNINEYNTDSDSDDWGEDEQKTKILSKKQKQTLAFQTLIRTAKTHFNNSEYLNFQQDLKLINNSIMTNKWSKKDYQMPKFFAKHMFEIFNKICDLNPENEQNQKEQTALKKLKKNFKKDLRHFKQLDVYNKNPSIGKWSNESSDLGEEENQQDIEESDDDALFQIADTAGGNEEENEESNEESNEEQNEEENEENDSEDSNEGSDSYWSSWEDNKVDVKEAESEESDVDEPGGDGKKDEDEDKNKKKTFGIEAFDEETLAKMRHRSFWVKKDKRVKKKESEKDRKRREKAAAQRIKKKEEAKKKEDEAKHTAENGDIKPVKVERKKKKHGPTKWSVNRINQTFAHVLTDRGKTNVNRDQIVNHLEELMEQCELHNAEQARLTVISVLISFYFDTASRKTTGMSGSRWRKTRGLISTMLKSLSKNINTFRVSNDADIRLILKETDDENKKEKDENSNLEWMKALEGGDTNDNNKTDLLKKKKDTISTGFSVIEMLSKKKKLDPKYQWIHGNMLSFIKKLTIQLWTNLKSLASKPTLYKKRLTNRELLLNTYKKAVFYYGKLKKNKLQSEIEVLSMSVIHNDYIDKLDVLNNKQHNIGQIKLKNKKKIIFGGKECEILNLPMTAIIVQKAIFVFEHGTTRNQTAAMLYLIFNMSIHSRYELCRDLLLMSHLGSPSRIGITSVELQILYNRALAAFSVCSFVYGNWYSCMIVLQELFSSNRYKILLAQGYTKAPIDDPKTTQEMIKLQQIQQERMLPQHFHINNDLLEASHLLSSLFCEIPNMMKNIYQSNGFIRNAYFRKVWHQYLRRDLRVPPENTKDYILQCGIYMQNGEWIKCKTIIKKLRIFTNKQVKHPKHVIKKIYSTVKRECLRCYLYRYGSCYKDISLEFLSNMFNLSIEHCKQFVSKLIITNHSNDIKFASFDELTQCIIIHQSPPRKIQRHALEYSDKLSVFVEQNEKLLGTRYSSYGGGSGKYNKHKSDNRDDKNKNKFKNKNKYKQYSSNKNRFGRSSHGKYNNKQADSKNSNQSESSNKRQFGGKINRTQLRSIRPTGR